MKKKKINIVRFRGPRVDPVNTKFYRGVLRSIDPVANQKHDIYMFKVTTEQPEFTKDFTPLLHQLKRALVKKRKDYENILWCICLGVNHECDILPLTISGKRGIFPSR